MEKLDIGEIITTPGKDPQKYLEVKTAEKVNEIVEWINSHNEALQAIT